MKISANMLVYLCKTFAHIMQTNFFECEDEEFCDELLEDEEEDWLRLSFEERTLIHKLFHSLAIIRSRKGSAEPSLQWRDGHGTMEQAMEYFQKGDYCLAIDNVLRSYAAPLKERQMLLTRCWLMLLNSAKIGEDN